MSCSNAYARNPTHFLSLSDVVRQEAAKELFFSRKPSVLLQVQVSLTEVCLRVRHCNITGPWRKETLKQNNCSKNFCVKLYMACYSYKIYTRERNLDSKSLRKTQLGLFCCSCVFTGFQNQLVFQLAVSSLSHHLLAFPLIFFQWISHSVPALLPLGCCFMSLPSSGQISLPSPFLEPSCTQSAPVSSPKFSCSLSGAGSHY